MSIEIEKAKNKVKVLYKKKDDHFYQIFPNKVIHVLKGQTINSLDKNYNEYGLQECTKKDFEHILRETIFELGIYEYCKSK